MENIDPAREQSGAALAILQSLQAHELHSASPVLWQSHNTDFYTQAIDQLRVSGLAYACQCNTQDWKNYRRNQQNCPCRELNLPFQSGRTSWRLRVGTSSTIEFNDRQAGHQRQNISLEVGDFALQRRDAYYAYQLAVVVDDARERISDVVRGYDLLTVTPRQIYLQQLLGLPTPRYLHLPLVLDSAGNKLSKQNKAPALADSQALDNLRLACQHLKLNRASRESNIKKLLHTGTEQWQELYSITS